MTATRTDTGCAAALVTSILAGDRELFAAVAGTMPRIQEVLADAAVLLAAAAQHVTSLAIGRDADDIDVSHAWHDCVPALAVTLAHDHGFTEAALREWLGWAGRVVLFGELDLPVCDQPECLAVTLALVAELFAPWPGQWQAFALREAAA